MRRGLVLFVTTRIGNVGIGVGWMSVIPCRLLFLLGHTLPNHTLLERVDSLVVVIRAKSQLFIIASQTSFHLVEGPGLFLLARTNAHTKIYLKADRFSTTAMLSMKKFKSSHD
jgi:hypothetical protein